MTRCALPLLGSEGENCCRCGKDFSDAFNGYGFRPCMVAVSLRGLKDVVRSLPGNDPLRLAVESQPDVLPAEEFIVLAKAWDRLAARR